MAVDFDSLRKRRPPTRKEANAYRNWSRYLRDSKLGEDEIHRRAADFVRQGMKAPGKGK